MRLPHPIVGEWQVDVAEDDGLRFHEILWAEDDVGVAGGVGGGGGGECLPEVCAGRPCSAF